MEDGFVVQVAPVDETTVPSDSILDNTKKLLGLLPDQTEFNRDILLHLNASIFTLSQLGVGSKGFFVTSSEQVYSDFLGERWNYLSPVVAMYLYYNVKLRFDPPQSSAVSECLKEAVKEIECRLSYEVDPAPTEESG